MKGSGGALIGVYVCVVCVWERMGTRKSERLSSYTATSPSGLQLLVYHDLR